MGCCQSSEKKDSAPEKNHQSAVPNEYTDGGKQNQVETTITNTPVVDSKGHPPADLTRELPPVPPESPPPSEENVYLARYSYNARTSEDLSFTKGDKLLIIGGTEGDWWMGKSLETGKEGYIPRNYVAPITSHESEE